MLGVVEGFAIAGGIAAIISAFKDGRSLFRSWRAQRKAKKDLRECDEVQESLRNNPTTIEKTYDEFHRKLGDVFGRGDDVAYQQLIRSLLRFNRTMAKCLQMSLTQHLDPDLKKLYVRSEKTAKETLGTLRDLYQRLSMAKTVPKNLSSPENQQSSSHLAGRGPVTSWLDEVQKQQLFQLPERSASGLYSCSPANASVECLELDLHSLRRRSSTTSLRSESSIVLQRNLAILSRR